MADGATIGFWSTAAAAGGALLWVLVRRARRARRLMPRLRLRGGFMVSLRTPESDPPKTARRTFRRDMLSMPEPGTSEPPIELEIDGLEELEPRERSEDAGPKRLPLSDRPTDRPTPENPRRRRP